MMYFSVFTGLLLLGYMGPTSALTVTPCRVHNMFIQPHFGTSVKTKEIIEILQVPPLLTQTLQVGICVSGNSTFTERLSHNLPRHICRQRYTSIEVYSKPRSQKIERLTTLRNIMNFMGEENLHGQGLVKELVLIEAGCDVFFNYLPMPSNVLEAEGDSLVKPIGVSELSEVNLPEVNNNTALNETDPDQAEAKKSKQETVLQKSYLTIQVDTRTANKKNNSGNAPLIKIENDFFRKELHLEKGLKNSSRDSESQDPIAPIEITTLTLVSSPEIQPHIADLKEDYGNDRTPTSSSTLSPGDFSLVTEQEDHQNRNKDSDFVEQAVSVGKNSFNIFSSEEEDEEEYDADASPTEGATGEFQLNPNDIGLPILIIDPNRDPILKLISEI